MTWPEPPHPMDGLTKAVLLVTAIMIGLWIVGAMTR